MKNGNIYLFLFKVNREKFISEEVRNVGTPGVLVMNKLLFKEKKAIYFLGNELIF